MNAPALDSVISEIRAVSTLEDVTAIGGHFILIAAGETTMLAIQRAMKARARELGEDVPEV